METKDWQSWAALAVVAFTIFVLVRNVIKSGKRKSSCGGSCGCSKKWTKEDFLHRDK